MFILYTDNYIGQVECQFFNVYGARTLPDFYKIRNNEVATGALVKQQSYYLLIGKNK